MGERDKPGCSDALLTLSTSIGVQEMRHDQETHLGAHKSEILVLPGSGRARQTEEDEPWKPNLEKHLEIQDAEHARIELGTHEEIVERVARHAVLGAAY